MTWRIGPGDRLALLGANGAGKTSLISLISGAVTASRGRVKIGKTVRLGVLDQQFSQLRDIGNDRVHQVLARTRASFTIDGKEYTPAQLLQRLGFAAEHLNARVDDLSGGQKRRLQILMLLLDEPNVLVLDEPTNDVDSQMLTALEELLDSWPGTLIVISHDRYLIERVTDMQYAIIDGTLRHLPGGIDEYLTLETRQRRGDDSDSTPGSVPRSGSTVQPKDALAGVSGAERRRLEKELRSIERQIATLTEQRAALDREMSEVDTADYVRLAELTGQRADLTAAIDEAEERWLEASVVLDR